MAHTYNGWKVHGADGRALVLFMIGMWLPLHKNLAAAGHQVIRVGSTSFPDDTPCLIRLGGYSHGPIVAGRFTTRTDEPFAVFLIGMRTNRPFAVRKWLPTVRAMGPMLKELYQHPEKGFLGAEYFFYRWGPAIVQYWRSFEELERFARNPDDPHLPAWQRFNRTIGSDGSVGIFHETYIVERGNYEAIYSNMPPFGLAKATEHVPAIGRRETARRRPMRGENEPAVPSSEQRV